MRSNRPPTRRRLARRAACAGLALATATWAAGASAQVGGGNIVINNVTTTCTAHQDNEFRYYVSYADCTGDCSLTFPATLTLAGSTTLEIWVSENLDCSLLANRDLNKSTSCRLIRSQTATDKNTTLTLKASEIVEALGIQNCEDSVSAARATKLYFLLNSSGTADVEPVNTAVWEDTKVDLMGPTPPTDLTVKPGERSLVIDYTETKDSDKRGYKVFCDPPFIPLGEGGGGGSTTGTTTSGTTGATTSGTTAGAGGAGGATGAGGAGGATGGGGAGGATGAGGAGGATGAGGAGGAAGAGGAGGATSSTTSGNATSTSTSTTTSTGATTSGGGSAPAGDCTSSVLVAGKRPDARYVCGTATGAQIEATGLTNGVSYVIGVAAYDDLENVGPLSVLGCATPVPVDDFFEEYRNAGGQGGGGFCSLARVPAKDALAALGALGAALGVLAARRRRRSGGSPS